VRPNYRLKGIWVSHTAHTITALEAVMARPELFGRMVTHRFPLERANEALEVMRTKEALKAVLVNR
jgi:threonine dehydrogenase-like Zn-dependent dehydrogenase